MSFPTSRRRLSGIRFEDRSALPSTLLPRMDVTAFVGFAAAGPLHTAVALESVARFEDVFGGDLALARVAGTGVTRRAYLAPTVRAFFANGGRRCWVVRVADERRAERARLNVPGVLRVLPSGAVQPGMAAASSVGAWSDELSVRTSLTARRVALGGAVALGSRAPRLTFPSSRSRAAEVGDVVRLRSTRTGSEGWIGFAQLLQPSGSHTENRSFVSSEVRWFVSASEPTPAASRAVLATRFDASSDGVDAAATWVERTYQGRIEAWPQPGSSGVRPQLLLDLEQLEQPESLVGQWLRVTHPGGSLWLFARESRSNERFRAGACRVVGDAWREGGTPDATLLDDASAWVVDVVALDVRAQLPGREGWQLRGMGLSPLHPRPWMALPSDEERFAARREPVAAVLESLWRETDAPPVPLATADVAERSDWFLPLGVDTIGAVAHLWHSSRTSLEREGLEVFGPELFLDEALSLAGVETLAGEADFVRLGLGQPSLPRGLRGLHALWSVEEVALIAAPDAVHAGWVLEPALSQTPPLPSAPIERAAVGVFLDCAHRVPAAPVLSIAQSVDAQNSFALTWTGARDAELGFVLEEARRPDWRDATVVWTGPGSDGGPMQHVLRGRTIADYYYRIFAYVPTPGTECAPAGIERSEWSNGVVVRLGALPDWQERVPRPYDSSTWLAVSRALARFCAARGDVLALLALPGHMREDDALELQSELRSPSGLAVAVGAQGSSLPLDLRESRAWGHVALYHPWLTGAAPGAPPFSVPPLGAISGTYAARSIERGPWLAPANQPLSGVIALAPVISADRREEFLERQLNLVRSEPSGFVVLSQDTLALEADGSSAVRPINVRRLLSLLRRFVLRIGEPMVFEPSGENLRLRTLHLFESKLAQLQARGAFAGLTAADSYQVECGDDLNPAYAAEAGRFTVQIKVAPSRPLAFLTLRLVQTGERGKVVEIL